MIECDNCHKETNAAVMMCAKCFSLQQVVNIRAFVERVEKRLPDYNTGKGADSWLKAYRLAVMDELAALEKETK